MHPVVLVRELVRDSGVPLAVQLADALRAAAVGGALRTGDRLPSTRALAVELGLSRTVTAAAYDQLLAEGWVSGRRGSGTYVTAAPAGSRAAAAPPARVAPSSTERPVADLRAGGPCTEIVDAAA